MGIELFSFDFRVFSILALHATWAISAPQQPCICDIGRGKFRDCNEKDGMKVWGNHHDDDIGLTGECLPPVQANSIKCFRWRVARECGEDNIEVRCSLKHRSDLDVTLEPTHQGQSVVFRSPGFDRRNTSKPKGSYYNRNFCIFNISLDCPSSKVELIPTELTNSLSDADTCQDYLSFHTHFSTHPLFKLCGRHIMDRDEYKIIPSSNFYGVLWTNDNNNERGRFQIQARCKINSEVDTGSGVQELQE